MAKITIRKSNGETLEISDINLTMQEIRELAGSTTNGNGNAPSTTRARRLRKQSVSMRINDSTPDYAGFKKTISDSGRKFIEVLRQHPNGILADNFAEKMGLKAAVQIGGITGGGLSKVAQRFNIDLKNIYTVEKKFENGMRSTTYTPGREIGKVQ
jgi:hypothetical protein